MNYRLKEVTLQDRCGLRAVFEYKQEEERIFECLERMIFSRDGSILLQGKQKDYLLVSDQIVSADHIVLHEAHPFAYTLKTASLHVLFWDNKEIFRIDDPAVEGFAVKSQTEWIVLYKDTFVRYLSGKQVEYFTLNEFKVNKGEGGEE